MNKRQRKKVTKLPWLCTRSGLQIESISRSVDEFGDCSLTREYPMLVRLVPVPRQRQMITCTKEGYYIDKAQPHLLDLIKRGKKS